MNTTLEYFQFQAPLYDAYQLACVPKYSEALSVLIECTEYEMRDKHAPRLLDVGCGTGNVTVKIMQALPTASVVCLDGSQMMLDAAREKLSSTNVTFHCMDLANNRWDQQWEDESFDAIYSAFVLEHLPFDLYKRFLFMAKRILKPGGPLITMEGYAGDLNQSIFFEHMNELEIEAVRTGLINGSTFNEMKRLSKDKERHYFATQDQKKQWWNETGFVDVEFYWQYYCIALLGGRKAD